MRSRHLYGCLAATAALALLAASRADAPVVRSRPDGLLEVKPPPSASVVRYTLDGSDPDRSAGVWLAPVNLPAGYTLKARAFSADGSPIGDVAVRDAPASSTRTPSTLVQVTQNRDWQIYDWVERHTACTKLMKERQADIVMLGDSITHFWGGEPVGGRRTGVAEWDRFFSGRSVVNLGFGWDRTENVLWRITHGEFDDARPKVVVLMIGTNNMDLNSVDEIAAGIAAICDELHRRSPSTRILLLGIFPRGKTPDATRAKVAAVNTQISKLNGKNNVTYLDIGHTFIQPDRTIAEDVMYDSLHPTAKGYAMWVEAMAPTLTRLLAE